jgi:selenide,water dikinase
LAQVLRPLRDHPATRHPDLIVGFGGADDAGVYRLGEGRALVQTVDFFTPIVDDAFDWGRIAAANALSDIYAMGGSPLTALQLLGWPRDHLPLELAGEVLRGGGEIMAAASCTIVGGHSIDSPEPTYGFAVTGLIGTDVILTNAGAQPGDRLVLTKPLGMGIIATAIKRAACPPGLAARAVEVMTTLNRPAAEAMVAAGAHAATDVTGYGLLGHLSEMLVASEVGASIDTGRVPVLEGVRELCQQGFYPGGSYRNLKAAGEVVAGEVDDITLKVLADAQTSGGLLIALAASDTRLGVEIGEITADTGRILLT